MTTTRLNLSRKLILVASGTFILLATLLFITTQVVAQDSNQVPDLQELETPQTGKDKLPKQIAFRTDNIDLPSTRFLGEHSNQQYWVAYDENGLVCVIGVFELHSGTKFASTGCQNAEVFNRRGLWIKGRATLSGETHYSSATVIPDGYFENADSRLQNAIVRSNLVIFDDVESVKAAVTAHGATVLIPPNPTGVAAEKDDFELRLPDPNHQ